MAAVNVPVPQHQQSESGVQTAQIDVSIVLPCLNEEETVGECVQKGLAWFERSGVTGEVIVVDNGSTDRSREEAERAGARVVSEPRKGYGSAHRRGFAEARGEIIVMADADGTYDLLALDPIIQPLRSGYDMTVGNRMGGMELGAMTWSHRVIGTPAINWLLSIFAGSRINDSQCGLRAFTRQACESMDLRSSGMELASEMILKAYRRGLRVAEVPISYAVRRGESKLNTIQDGWRHLRFLLLYSPLYLFLMPGVIFVVLGLAALGVTLGAGGGLTIGGLTWQPVFAGGLLLIIGTNALMIGFATHLYAAAKGMIVEDRLTQLLRSQFTLERVLGLAGVLLFVGVGVDALLFYSWVSGNDLGLSTAGLAAAAQSSIIIGTNVALGGFLVALMDIE